MYNWRGPLYVQLKKAQWSFEEGPMSNWEGPNVQLKCQMFNWRGFNARLKRDPVFILKGANIEKHIISYAVSAS